MLRLNRQRGSALVIAILVLFILTTLGMALMLSSSQEADISVNHRWGEMAFYNAEASLEVAKNVLAGYAVRDGSWVNVLPPARGPAEMSAPPADASACDPNTAGCRDYQYRLEEGGVQLYIGRVLRDQNGRALVFDFRNPTAGDTRGDIDGDGAQDIQGTGTVWIRRPLSRGEDYGFTGNLHDRVIVTAEGTAPNFESAQYGRPGSLRRLEMALQLPPADGVSGEEYADETRAQDQGSDAATGGSSSSVK